MGRIRVPSPTPSVGSDAPIPETLSDDPPNIQVSRGGWFPQGEKGSWVLFLGNLHPHVVEKDLFDLLRPFLGEGDKGITSLIIRTTRGYGVNNIPSAAVGKSDRSYATVRFARFAMAEAVLEAHREDPPILYGLKVTTSNNPADLPDCRAITSRVLSPKSELRKRKPKRLAAEKTELESEGEQRPLAGPSRRSSQPKPRHNPLAR